MFAHKSTPVSFTIQGSRWLCHRTKYYGSFLDVIKNSVLQTIAKQSTRSEHKIPRAVFNGSRQTVSQPSTRLGLPDFNRKRMFSFQFFVQPCSCTQQTRKNANLWLRNSHYNQVSDVRRTCFYRGKLKEGRRF